MASLILVNSHPVIEILKNLVTGKAEEQYVQAFESDHAFGNRDVLIEKVWGKSALDKKYRELFKKWHEILSKDGDKAQKFSRVINEYITLLRMDPGLPIELMGQSWIGYEAMNIFKEIRGILLS
jgi:phenylacetic acid degradation operon negative regulatory protein